MEQLIILQGITVSELLAQIETIIDKRIFERVEKLKSENSKKYLSRKETATLLKITLPTLHEWTKMGWLKSYKIGSRVLYIEQELESSLSNQKNQSLR